MLRDFLEPNIQNKLAFRSALVYLFKKCLLGLQCLIPDEHVHLELQV